MNFKFPNYHLNCYLTYKNYYYLIQSLCSCDWQANLFSIVYRWTENFLNLEGLIFALLFDLFSPYFNYSSRNERIIIKKIINSVFVFSYSETNLFSSYFNYLSMNLQLSNKRIIIEKIRSLYSLIEKQIYALFTSIIHR